MPAIQIVFGVILLLFSIAITIIVILQEGHQQNVGAITGGADTFLSKNKARSVDAFLVRWTKVITIGFFALVVAINIFMFFAQERRSAPRRKAGGFLCLLLSTVTGIACTAARSAACSRMDGTEAN